MRQIYSLLLFFFFCLAGFQSLGQSGEDQQLGLPGDNLNLYAVLKIFQESKTLEIFEKSLNDESLKINNLDLDGNGQIDYILVDDNVAGDLHNITLKVAVNKNEYQDVAVIAVDKDGAGKVNIQVIGDEDLYGKDYIIEPNYEDVSESTPNPGYKGNTIEADNMTVDVVRTSEVQVAAWPVITYIYVPTYNRWRSPWHYGYYPTYWRPWKPFYWHYYYGYHYHLDYFYFSHYRRWHTYRIPGWYNSYYKAPYRARSVIVQNRIKKGNYKQTYTRPQLAKDGSASFKKDFPKSPSANAKLPPFDNNRKPVVRPVTKPVTKPVTTRPVTRPVTKPVTRPVTTRPVTKPVTKPITRPVTNPVTKPITKPITRPVAKPAVQPPSIN